MPSRLEGDDGSAPGSDREQPDRSAGPPSKAARRIVRAVACALLLFHMAAMLVANLPRTSTLGRLRGPFEGYLWWTTQWQRWDMFTTAPLYLDLEPRLVAIDHGGARHAFGALLPGLEPYKKRMRLHGTFARLTFFRRHFAPYVLRYTVAACGAIDRRTNIKPRAVALELGAKRIRNLDRIRDDDRIADPVTMPFAPVRCP